MKFTEAEVNLLIKNTKQIFEYLKTNVAPSLKLPIYYDFEDNPRFYKIRLRVYPANGNFTEIQLKRAAINSTVYKLGDNYDSDYTKSHSGSNLYNEYEVMYHLILNWKNIKEDFAYKVSEINNNIELLKSFSV